MEKLLNSPPSFFENVVVDLLLKMGYGYDSNSGIVTGKSHDGGIDGEINEDKLGLDKIYIQAKRYAKTNHISRNELQAFVRAMEGVLKGVFITTSSFTNEAKKYAAANQVKHIRLIDGEMLTSLMIHYGIGVTVRKTVSIYSIDQSYFE